MSAKHVLNANWDRWPFQDIGDVGAIAKATHRILDAADVPGSSTNLSSLNIKLKYRELEREFGQEYLDDIYSLPIEGLHHVEIDASIYDSEQKNIILTVLAWFISFDSGVEANLIVKGDNREMVEVVRDEIQRLVDDRLPRRGQQIEGSHEASEGIENISPAAKTTSVQDVRSDSEESARAIPSRSPLRRFAFNPWIIAITGSVIGAFVASRLLGF